MLVREIDFMEYFEKNLIGKNSSTFDVINTASKLAGRPERASCPSCTKAEYYELLNVYNRLLPSYLEYIRTKVETPIETIPEPIPDVYTKYEIIEEDKPVVVKSKKTLK